MGANFTVRYDHPDYLTIRTETVPNTALSANAAQTAFVGSTLKSYRKALVLGCTFVIGSAGSVAGTRTVAIYRGTSSQQKFTGTISVGTSAAGDVWDCSLTTGVTIASIGQVVTLKQDVAATSALADEKFVISDLIWRYKLLPSESPS